MSEQQNKDIPNTVITMLGRVIFGIANELANKISCPKVALEWKSTSAKSRAPETGSVTVDEWASHKINLRYIKARLWAVMKEADVLDPQGSLHAAYVPNAMSWLYGFGREDKARVPVQNYVDVVYNVPSSKEDAGCSITVDHVNLSTLVTLIQNKRISETIFLQLWKVYFQLNTGNTGTIIAKANRARLAERKEAVRLYKEQEAKEQPEPPTVTGLSMPGSAEELFALIKKAVTEVLVEHPQQFLMTPVTKVDTPVKV